MVRVKTLGPRVAAHDRRVSSGPKRADAELLTAEHRAWRAGVLKRAGYRCEWIMADGTRCPKAAPAHRLVADHVHERKDDGPLLGRGQCLCVQHNTLKGVLARAKRHEG